jgi:3-dehydroquinate dehydratase II
MSREVWVLHGPNLGLLGRREPGLYGRETLETIDRRLADLGESLGLRVQSFQTNHEGALVDRLTIAMDEVDGLLLNPAALSHMSLALTDALRAITIPVVEVHMTNLYAREERRISLTASAVRGVIMGFGPSSYDLGLRALAGMLERGRGRSVGARGVPRARNGQARKKR